MSEPDLHEVALQAGMSLDEVSQLVGSWAIFLVTEHSAMQPIEPRAERAILEGEGSMGGITQTKTPLNWSIHALSGLQTYRKLDKLTTDDLRRPGMLESTFFLSAREAPTDQT